mmetsp:Transcript_39420/g.70506  ORF Transcript_39420/g.70506 Transcript_39420/m.70506 type:complete len:261 (-) Transcript_39420:73-855(-)
MYAVGAALAGFQSAEAREVVRPSARVAPTVLPSAATAACGCLPLFVALGSWGKSRAAKRPYSGRWSTTPRLIRAAELREDLPKCVVFDLDGCLWYPEMYELSWQRGGAPFSLDAAGVMRDRGGCVVSLHSGVDAALTELATDAKWQDAVVAVASCCDVPQWAHELLGKFEFGSAKSKSKLASVLTVRQIHKGSKQDHFREIAETVGCEFEEMIFFDNEKYNCDQVARLGVTCIYCPDGVTSAAWSEGMEAFPSPGRICCV